MSGRVAWFFVFLVLILEVVSSYLFLVAARFSPPALFDPAQLAILGSSTANLRLAALLDMGGYLAAIPLALYLRHRFRDEARIGVFTLAGILFLCLGAAGGALLALVGPAVYGIVVFGVWQGVDPVLVAIWLIPIGVIARRKGARVLPFVLIPIAVLGLAVPLAHLAGLPPGLWRG